MSVEPRRLPLASTFDASVDEGSFRPLRFRLHDREDRERADRLLASGSVRSIHDRIEQQIAELLETRAPWEKRTRAEWIAKARERLERDGGRAYGEWVFYPWSGRFVHLLPRDEFRELRTSRNRNKITRDEQEKLGSLVLGVVGLSVGQSTAVTLALEGIGGWFRLADFDSLDLSNMNRLRAGVHEIGLNKAILTARQISEIDPYLDVTVFTDGIVDENLEPFLLGPPRLDLLFEECDDLAMKVLLREHARAQRIPVLMETSDRGMLDIERFDLEPERPLLHGLLGSHRASELRGLTTADKVPIVLDILGMETISDRMKASLIDIESSLKTWPQLASAVALGGALNAEAARRIALGQLTISGRFYADLEDLLVPARASNPTLEARPAEPVPPTRERPPPLPGHVSLDEHAVRTWVTYGTMAPSGGNVQPWHFTFRSGRLVCALDPARLGTLLDYGRRASHLALGAAIENIELAARATGWEPETKLFPTSDPLHVAELVFRPAPPDPLARDLAEAAALRVTNRRLATRMRLEAHVVSKLTRAAEERRGRLHLLTSDEALDRIASILAEGDRIRFLDPRLHREMMSELRFTTEESHRSRDGIDLATLEPTAADRAAFRMLRSPDLMKWVRELGGGEGLGKAARKSIAASAAVGVLTIEGTDPESYVRGGRAMQRVWLEATRQGLAFQPMSALLYLFARLGEEGARELAPHTHAALTRLRPRFETVVPKSPGQAELLLFRLAVADAPSASALRRPVDEVLSFE